MASISDKLDGVIKEFNELIEESGGTPPKYTGGLTIMEHVEHLGKLIDSMPHPDADAAEYAQQAAQSASEAAESASIAQGIEESIPDDYSELSEDVAELKSAFENDLLLSVWSPAITAGSRYGKTDGATGNHVGRARTTAKMIAKGSISGITLDSESYKYYITYYNASDVYVNRSTDWIIGVTYFTSADIHFGLTFARSDEGTWTSDDTTAVLTALKAYTAGDTSLSHGNVAADAKATGERIAVIDQTITKLTTTDEVLWQGNWEKGYYNSNDGTPSGSSNYYMRTKTAYAFDKSTTMVTAQVPATSGYGIRGYIYNGQGSYQGIIGSMIEPGISPSISFIPQSGYTYTFAVGRFADGDSGTKIVDATFMATVKLFVTHVGDKKMRSGDFEWFNVTVDRPLPFGGEEQTTGLQEVECVLRLPSTYTSYGTPTRLVLACHGASGYIQKSTTTWYNSNWKTFMDALLDAGYAVFDANVLPTSTGTEQMGAAYGSPLYVNVLKKAYDYIQQNYNVYPQIFAHGTSQGGVGATAFSHAYPNLVLAESSFAGRDILHYIAGLTAINDTMAISYGYESLSALTADKFSHVEGMFPSLSLVKYVNGVAQIPPDRETAYADWTAYFSEPASLTGSDEEGIWFGKRQVPYKAWNSMADNDKDCRLQTLLKRAYNRGNSCPYYAVTYDSGTHTQMSYGQINNMIPQLIAWYKRWE